ncbi:hypothetical protein [Leptolyngbya sp. GB1-A1]
MQLLIEANQIEVNQIKSDHTKQFLVGRSCNQSFNCLILMRAVPF